MRFFKLIKAKESVFNYFKKFFPNMEMVNENNFYLGTYGEFTSVSNPPDREPDYISDSGSQYWYENNGVYRQADHWGWYLASCHWILDGYQGLARASVKDAVGFAKWEDFIKYRDTRQFSKLLCDYIDKK